VSVKIVLTILIAGVILTLYVMLEKRINQRPCLECGAKISAADAEGRCPNCRSFVE
jgi:Zn finger protein HypA/HybF involved in hydrogenase expression